MKIEPYIVAIYIGILLIVWCAAMYYVFRVIALRKPGVRIWRDTYLNPFHLLVMTSKLTEAGLKARRNCYICSIIFAIMVLIPVLLTHLLK